MRGIREDFYSFWNMVHGLPSLKALVTSGALTFSEWESEFSFPNLKMLNLYECLEMKNKDVISILKGLRDIEHLNIGSWKIESDIFNQIEKFDKLTVLNLRCSRQSFDYNVQNCLRKLGYRLNILDLGWMKHVDLGLLVEWCPNLDELYLVECFLEIPKAPLSADSTKICSELKKLHISGFYEGAIPILDQVERNPNTPALLNQINRFFLRDSKINDLKLHHCNQEFVDYILDHFEGSFLRRLEFDGCFGTGWSLTDNQIMKCLVKYQHLEKVEINKCFLSDERTKYLKQLIMKSNVGLSLNISPMPSPIRKV